MIRQDVSHVADTYQLEVVPVSSNNVVTYRPEYGSLLVLVTSIQVRDPAVLEEVADQFYETVLREEVRHLLDPWDPRFVKVHVQVPDENGVPEALKGLLQIRQVIQRRRG